MSKRFTDPNERLRCAATRAARSTAVELLESRLMLSAAIFSSPQTRHSSTVRWNNHNVQAAPGEWVIRVNNVGGKSIDDTRGRLQSLLHKRRSDLTVVEIDPVSGLALVKAPQSLKPTVVSRAISGVKGFKSITPNYTYSINHDLPNDTMAFQQWPLFNVGQTGGQFFADMHATQAWDFTTGDAGTVVAVLDSGVDYTHPDLAANIWTNVGEIAGNGIDDDNDGFVDDVHGYDFANDDADPMDDHGHGTHVSGIIAAVGNNDNGITGVAWNAKILPVKMLDENGLTTSFDAIRAVDYVTHLHRDLGVNVRVMNASWSGPDGDPELQTAIYNAGEAGILFVAAAGNSSSPAQEYPASFGLENVISVGATDNRDNLANFTNWGPSVQIYAPGVDVLSTVPYSGGPMSDPSGYALASGTSMAAPHVAGFAALAFSLAGDASFRDVRYAMLNTADRLNDPRAQSGFFPQTGRLNAGVAINQIGARVKSSTPAAGSVVTGAPPTDFVIRFTEPVSQSTLQASDLTVNGIPANTVDFALNAPMVATFHYTTSPVTSAGEQTMSIVDGAIGRRSDGWPVKAWSAVFRNDGVSFGVVSTTPAVGADVPLPMTTLDVIFSAPVSGASLQQSDLTLSVGTVTGVSLLNPTTVRFALSGITKEGVLNAAIHAGSVNAVAGGQSAEFSATYFLDQVDGALAASLVPIAPLGSDIYRATATGFIGSGSDTDRYSIALDPGQTAALTVRPADAALRPSVTLLGPGGAAISTASASASGAPVVIPIAPATSAGTYTIVIGSADASLPGAGGSYAVDLALNSALEAEGRGGAANDSRGAAQDLDAAFTLPGGVRRAAVMGALPAAGAASSQDWYAVTLSAGESPSIAGVLQAPGGSLRLHLYDATGASLAGGTAWNNGQVLAGFTAPSSGTYYLRVSGTGGDYAVVVTDAVIDREPNNSPVAASALGGRRSAIGYVSGTSASFFNEVEANDDGVPGLSLSDLAMANDLSGTFVRYTSTDTSFPARVYGTISAGNDGDWDFWRFNAQPGDSVTLSMDTLGGFGTLNPYLRLVDNTGRLLAADDDSAGGQSNARVTYNAFSYTGDYYVIADSFASSTQPGYGLSIELTTSNLQRTLGPDDYRVTLAAGQSVQISTTTPCDGPGAIVNSLDPTVELFDPSGALVASDTNGAADGRNALLTYTAPAAGLYVIAVSAAGSTAGEYVVNIVDAAPSAGAPGVPVLAPASDTGLLASDGVTNRNSALQCTVPGVTSGATVFLYADGSATALGSAVAQGTAATIVTDGAALADGVHSITARQSIGGGPLSAASPSASLTIDTVAPAPAFGAPDLRNSDDSGVSATDNITNDITPSLDFAVPAGSYFRVFRDGVPVSGTFGPGTSFTSAELADGGYDFIVRVVDVAGNESASSAALHVTIDTAAPAAPGALDLQAASDSGILSDDNLTNVVNPTFDVAEIAAGTYVRVYRGIIPVSDAYASSPVTTNVRQPDGAWGYYARAVDAAGNVSLTAGPTLNVTVDTLAWTPAVDGALDPTFGNGGKVVQSFGAKQDYITDLLLMPDNKVVAAGYATYADGSRHALIARYSEDGTLDASFGVAGVQTIPGFEGGAIFQMTLMHDGKILATGDGGQNGKFGSAVIRLTADGQLDPTFGSGGISIVTIGIYSFTIESIAVQTDDKILVASTPLDGTQTDFGLARLNADGSIDTTFGLAGKVETDISGSNDGISAVIVQPDDGILVIGGTHIPTPARNAIALARYRPDGSLDPAFGDGGRKIVLLESLGYSVADAKLAPDGKILLVGGIDGPIYSEALLMRLNPDGSFDTTFGTGGVVRPHLTNFGSSLNSVNIQADGRIVASGSVSGAMVVARFRTDGTLDPTFGDGGKAQTTVTPYINVAYGQAVLPDGRIVIAGVGSSAFAQDAYDSALVRFGNGPIQAPPVLQAASDDGTPGDGITTQTTLSFDLNPQDPFFHFYRDDQQIAGGYQGGTAYTAASQPSGTHTYGFKAVDRAGNESGLSKTTTVTINSNSTTATVVSHKLFYNNSKFDSGTGSDDSAIATDKVPLLAGAGRATFANVSSYDKGINGVMVDIAGLPAGAGPAAADFAVAVSTDGVTWIGGPVPTSVTTRRQQGTAQSDRVTLIWPDNSIKNKWLRLTAKVTNATGLPSADVSYFGSAVGDTGNGLATDALVNVDSADYYGVRDHLRSYDNPAPVMWNWDINRDGVTDITDIMLVRAGATTASTALQLITIAQPPVPVIASNASPAAKESETIKAAPAVTVASSTRSIKTATAMRTRVGWRPLT